MLKRLFLCVLIFLFNLISFAQNREQYKKIDWRIYNSLNWREYVDYQSDEWKNMSIEDKNSLLKIPDSVLNTMSTKELIEASIDCHFARRIGLFSMIDNYYKKVEESFNGFSELLSRKDVVEKLISYYNDMDITKDTYSPAGLSQREQIQIIEYLMVHPQLLSKYDLSSIETLTSELLSKYEIKTNMGTVYEKGDLISNIYAIAKLIEIKNHENSQNLKSIGGVEIFLESGLYLTDDIRNHVLSICKSN